MIYIYTFGNKVIKVINSVPLELGADRRQFFLYDLKDNTGDNISSQNEYFGELTGMYWVWKNCRKFQPTDIIGFCHYNKGFRISEKSLNSAIGGGIQWITLLPIKIRNHPVPDEVAAIERILKIYYPDYFCVWTEFYDEEAAGRFEVCRGSNMFITTYEEFDKYCEWLFDILFKLREIVGDKPETGRNMRRYCAFAGERLLSVYLKANEKKVYSVETRYKNWWLPYLRKLRDYLKVNKNSRLYLFLKSQFGYKSSYKE